MQEYKIRRFDMSKMKSDSIVMLLAKRRTGKSFLCRDIMHTHRDLPTGIVISPTEKANKFYGDFIPDLYIYNEYTQELLQRFLRRQERIREVGKQRDGVDERAFLIMDDCMFDTKWVKDSEMREVFMNGRHLKVFCCILMQYSLGIPPALRSNIDYVFILKETNITNRRKLFEHYAGVFPSFPAFNAAMDQCTNDFSCLVIDNTRQSNDVEDQVFWYKAEPHDDFRVGCDRYWKYSDSKYDPNHLTVSGKVRLSGPSKKTTGKTEYSVRQVGLGKDAIDD
jgi:hypothetical protein